MLESESFLSSDFIFARRFSICSLDSPCQRIVQIFPWFFSSLHCSFVLGPIFVIVLYVILVKLRLVSVHEFCKVELVIVQESCEEEL